MKLALCFPAGGGYDPRTSLSISRLYCELAKERIPFYECVQFTNPDLAGVHNLLFHDALESGADVILNIDSDMVFDAKDAVRFLLEETQDIVAGNYAKKTFGANAGMAGTPRPGGARFGNLVEADNIGTGFCRITRRALERLAANSPRYIDRQTGLLLAEIMNCGLWGGAWGGPRLLNDEWMVRRWESLGELAWIDESISLGHVGTHEFRSKSA